MKSGTKGQVNGGRKRGSRVLNVILVVILLVGIGLLVYPTFSDWWNSQHQTRAIVNYDSTVAEMDDSETEEMLAAAIAYNEWLYESNHGLGLDDDELEEYESILDVTGTGIMGYIEIEKIDVYLPIYHTTSDSVLAVATGHLEGTSLPVGGESTHCVISGHRGLTSARLFTDLDELELGDTFTIHVLGEVLTYEVDQILIVLPTETSALNIEEGEDYVTLLTCTPYGINTHRLLVRGHRVETVEESTVVVTADATQIDSTVVAFVLAVVMIVIFLVIMLVKPVRKKR